MADLSDHVRANRAYWDGMADWWLSPGQRHWQQAEPTWGQWAVPESTLHVLPDVRGLDVLDDGCGTAYWSAWLARMGARPVGIDNSRGQLSSARQLQREHGLSFPLLHADAERLPFADSTFDMVLSEYGASIWCDPYAWVAEAVRVLRPGGRLVFLRGSTLQILCTPDEGLAGPTLLRSQFGMHRFEWHDERSVEFHLSHGDWIRLLRACGFDIEDLIELQASENAHDTPWASAEWAQRWPSEEIWVVRKPPR
jgi:SAM-dependent methyltransferase